MIAKEDMATRVGQKMGIISVGETLSYEDSVLIQERLLAARDQLETLEIVELDLESGIDEVYADAVAMIVAAMCVDEFTLPEPRRSTLRAEGLLGLPNTSLAERILRKLTYRPAVHRTTAVDYY